MERNAILATALVILILMGYQWYLSRFEPAPQEPARPAPATPATAPTAAPPAAASATPPPKATPKPKGYTPTSQLGLTAREVIVETPLLRVTLSTAGARVTSWQLKHYRVGNGAPVELVALKDPAGVPGPLAAWADGEQAQAVYRAEPDRLDLTGRDAAGGLTFTQGAAS
ncbi:MAG: membrane protein insertase YidC, partial [candidate division NC10 bacterium]|nr:membrane protein insertase YidC [candidate division NC10 bacterium]